MDSGGFRGTSSRRTPYRRRSRGPDAPLRSGGGACCAPSDFASVLLPRPGKAPILALGQSRPSVAKAEAPRLTNRPPDDQTSGVGADRATEQVDERSIDARMPQPVQGPAGNVVLLRRVFLEMAGEFL